MNDSVINGEQVLGKKGEDIVRGVAAKLCYFAIAELDRSVEPNGQRLFSFGNQNGTRVIGYKKLKLATATSFKENLAVILLTVRSIYFLPTLRKVVAFNLMMARIYLRILSRSS